MLVSSEGKKVQLNKAKEDTRSNVDTLQKTYNINNIAIIIYCADIMNQYGSGINNAPRFPKLKGCMTQASTISQNSNGVMEQLDEFRSYWDKATGGDGTCKGFLRGAYYTRRDRVYAYIKQLYDQGKLTNGTDLTSIQIGSSQQGKFIWPCDSRRITSYVGSRNSPTAGASTDHQGMDIGLSSGSKVYASADGIAYIKDQKNKNGTLTGYGHYIYIKHADNYWTLYAHLQTQNVVNGQSVKQGQVIGISDNTGTSTGPHLHFELKQYNGSSYPFRSNHPEVPPLNPLMFLPGGQEIWNKHIGS